MSITEKLHKAGKLPNPPLHVLSPELEVIMGSFAYGVSGKSSDMDVNAVCIPPKEMVFPHLSGMVPGFGPPLNTFQQYQQHHIDLDDKEYDLVSFSLIKFFQLAAENNPNIIDVLFVPERCITHMTEIGKLMRDNRKEFLHKGAYHKFKGYAYSQMQKIKTMKPVGKRAELVEKFGYDTKFAYHVVRLANEAESILMTGDLDIEASKEQLKAIRAGSMTLDELVTWFKAKEAALDQLYITSTLQHSPDMEKLNRILMACLESKYGSLDNLMQGGIDYRRLAVYDKIEKLVRSL